MSPIEKAEFRAALREALAGAIDCMGMEAFKRTSFFGSNDAAFTANKLKVLKEAA